MIARSETEGSYKFGFGGQEMDNEITGISGIHYYAEYWQYDSRLARRWNMDPVIKYQESPYVAFANNAIWFIDPLGADTMLVDSKTNKPIDNLMKKGGEDVIFLSGESGTWEGAKQIFYEIGEITGQSGGTPSKKGEPVKWRWTNIYGVTQYLQDQTERFNDVMEKWEAYSEAELDWIIENVPLNSRATYMMVKWRALVTDGAPMDIKDPNNPDSFSPTIIGEWSWQNGMLTRYDDYGNINYGRAGAAYGFNEGTLLFGSNVNQMWKDLKSSVGFGKTTGMGDDDRDIKAMKFGIDLYRKNNVSNKK